MRTPLRLPGLRMVPFFCLHAVTTTPAVTDGIDSLVPFHRLRPSPSVGRVGSCISCFGACSVLLHVRPARLAESPEATLFIRGSGSFVTSATAPIATGWSEPVPGREFHPQWTSALHGAPARYSCSKLWNWRLTI